MIHKHPFVSLVHNKIPYGKLQFSPQETQQFENTALGWEPVLIIYCCPLWTKKLHLSLWPVNWSVVYPETNYSSSFMGPQIVAFFGPYCNNINSQPGNNSWIFRKSGKNGSPVLNPKRTGNELNVGLKHENVSQLYDQS